MAALAVHAAPTRVDLHPGAWAPDDGAELRYDQATDTPLGALTVRHGGAVLRDTTFTDGTIEYDVRELADNGGIPGLWFHRRDAQVAENVYLRLDSGCHQTGECVQYAPVARGNVQWDVYPEYEADAPIHDVGWNHVKLVISGKRMRVFINGQATPALDVAQLEGDGASGGLAVRGDATYANLFISPDVVDGLSREPLPDTTADDPTYLRQWQVGPVEHLERGQAVSLPDRPSGLRNWPPLAAERKGFVNLGRANGTARDTPDLAWLHATVESDRPQVRHVSLGWAREIWVFANGKPVFVAANHYYPAAARRAPLGRMALANDGFELPLQAGSNEIDVAISDDLPSARHWGWGFVWKFDQIDGLALPRAGAGM